VSVLIPPFVGRTDAMDRLRARLEAARSAPQLVVVVGEGGIGKTTLVRRFTAAALAPEIWVSGDELETDLAFGVVDQLLSAAAADPVPPGADALGAGAALLAAFDARDRGIHRSGPLVVVVDDIGLADVASLQAFSFTIRRLRADPVLVIATLRPDQLDRLPEGLLRMLDGDRGERLVLDGLGTSELAELAQQLLGADLPPASVRALAEHTGGNPLYVTALAEELPLEALLAPSAGVLPAPRSFASLVLVRLAACAPETERLVATVAVMGQRAPCSAALAAAGPDDPDAALDEACGQGLLQLDEGPLGPRLGFPHPLVHSAVLHDLSPSRRRELHARVAATTGDEERRLQHLALAASGPDPDLCAALEAHGRAELGRSTHAAPAAARAFRLAARLAPDQATQHHLVLSALETSMLAGDAVRAAELAPALEDMPDSPRRRLALGALALGRGDLPTALEELQLGWDLSDETTPEVVRASIAGQLANITINAARLREAVEWARRAKEAWGDAVDPTGMADLGLALALGSSGEVDEARAITADLPEDGPLDIAGVARLTGRGVVAMWSDRPGAAEADLRRAAAQARRLGAFLPGAIASYYRAEALYRLGRWDDAGVQAEAVASAALDADQRWFLALPLGVAALPCAARGDLERADAYVAAAEEHRAALGDAASALWAWSARMAVDVARGEHAAVLATAGKLEALPADATHLALAVKPWRIVAAEAAAALGDVERGWQLLEPAGAATASQPSMALGLCRASAQLCSAAGDPDGAASWFARGRQLGVGAEDPFQVAQFDLAEGAFLRRRGQRREAIAVLERARAGFDRLRSAPWSARTDDELRAAGRSVSRNRSDAVALTSHEHAVASLAARGLRNREVAAELYISVKTVEYHLGNVYRKLGLTNRAQLAQKLDTLVG
jgi:DNA-binding CsgD family transcriptional regulator